MADNSNDKGMVEAQVNKYQLQRRLPLTSLIICSRNRPQLLIETVESVLQGEEVPTELVIVDQSDVSNPKLEKLTTDRPCQIRYVRPGSVGLSRARNSGIAAAQYDILAFTDDDVELTSSWFRELVRALLSAGPRAAVTGRVLVGLTGPPGGFAPSTKSDLNPVVYEGRIGEDVLYPNNAALFRSAFKDVGDFDIRLGAGGTFCSAEDNDFGFRLLEAGYRIVYAPEAVLYHRAWRDEGDYSPLRWSYGYGQGAYFAKHLSLRDRYMLWRMVRHIKNHMVGFLRRVWSQPRLAYGDAVYVWALLCGATKWLFTQRMVR